MLQIDCKYADYKYANCPKLFRWVELWAYVARDNIFFIRGMYRCNKLEGSRFETQIHLAAIKYI